MTLYATNQPQDSPKLLRQILVKIQELTAVKQKTLVVFDLDSTLFDVSPRLQQILIDFAEDPQHQNQFPEAMELFRNIRTQRTDWGIKQALVRAGLDQHSSDLHLAVKNFWLKTFFSNTYLHFDEPFAGSVEFVNHVANAGAEVVYLTGRDQQGMEAGSREVLAKWNFPLDEVQSRLVLKPIKGSDDAEFKRDWFLNLDPDKYSQIWFFENEPLNVNLIYQHLPHIDIVFFDSTHSGQAHPPSHLPKIMHFLLRE